MSVHSYSLPNIFYHSLKTMVYFLFLLSPLSPLSPLSFILFYINYGLFLLLPFSSILFCINYALSLLKWPEVMHALSSTVPRPTPGHFTEYRVIISIESCPEFSIIRFSDSIHPEECNLGIFMELSNEMVSDFLGTFGPLRESKLLGRWFRWVACTFFFVCVHMWLFVCLLHLTVCAYYN